MKTKIRHKDVAKPVQTHDRKKLVITVSRRQRKTEMLESKFRQERLIDGNDGKD